MLSTDVYSPDPPRKACLNPTHDDISKTEELRIREKKSVIGVAKGLGINHARTDGVGNHADEVRLIAFHRERRKGPFSSSFQRFYI